MYRNRRRKIRFCSKNNNNNLNRIYWANGPPRIRKVMFQYSRRGRREAEIKYLAELLNIILT